VVRIDVASPPSAASGRCRRRTATCAGDANAVRRVIENGAASTMAPPGDAAAAVTQSAAHPKANSVPAVVSTKGAPPEKAPVGNRCRGGRGVLPGV